MKLSYVIFITITLLILVDKIEGQDLTGKYYANGQVCTVIDAYDINWELILKSDYTFEYNRRQFDTKSKDSTSLKLIGSWNVQGDSILILQNIVRLQNDICPLDKLIYRIDNQKLYSTFGCFDYFSGFDMYFEFLERNNSFVKS